MTVICALHDPDAKCTWIGSDTQSCNGDMRLDVGPKWTRWGAWAVGHAGEHRASNVIAHNAKRLFDDIDGPFTFAERLRSVLEADGFRQDEEPGSKAFGQSFVLANPSSAWEISPDFAIVEARNRLAATGSGREVAKGAGHALRNSVRCDIIVRAAVEAAIALDVNCGGTVYQERLSDG